MLYIYIYTHTLNILVIFCNVYPLYTFTISITNKNLKIKIYGTIILPLVLYGCETWSLTLREERKLRVFENMVLRRIFDLGGRR